VSAFFGEVGDNAGIRRTDEDCDRAGGQSGALHSAGHLSYWAKRPDALDLSRRLNDHMAEVVRAHPGRFDWPGHVHLQ